MKKSRKAAETIKVIVLILCCILFLLPVYFLVMNSFKSLNEILISFISLPKQFTLRNYAGAMEKIRPFFFCSSRYWRMFQRSSS